MRQGLFVTGTDTGVGKTAVTAGVLRALRRRGIDAVPMKPVETGAESADGAFRSRDLAFCLQAAGLLATEEDLALMSPYCYGPASSPHLAGRLADRYADPSHILACAEELAARHECVLVEGAGGVMAPVDESNTMLDLMRKLALPVLLVARLRLGTINHCLLSFEALRSRGLDLLGVVFNEAEPGAAEEEYIQADNPVAVARFGGTEVLGIVRHHACAGRLAGDFFEQFEREMWGMEKVLERVTAK